MVYGSVDDPGVEWKTVSYPSYSSDRFAPTTLERASRTVWREDDFEQSLLISDCDLALHDLKSREGLPGMSVQISLFGDGGYAIGVKLAHVLGDAQSFVHMWAVKSRNLHHDKGSPSLFDFPIFDPKRLDDYASGDINRSEIDPHLAAATRALPLHQADAHDFPSFLGETLEKTMPPSSFLKNINFSLAHSAPWSSWDRSKPVSCAYIHFSGNMLDELQSSARGDLNEPLKLSRLDVLLAHLWSAINRARKMEQSPHDVFINLTLGARVRVSPPFTRLMDRITFVLNTCQAIRVEGMFRKRRKPC